MNVRSLAVALAVSLTATMLSAQNDTTDQANYGRTVVVGSDSRVASMIQILERQVNQLTARVKYLQDQQASLAQEVQDLRRATQMARSDKSDMSNVNSQINQLRREIASDRERNQAAMRRVIDQVTAQTAKAVNSAVASAAKAGAPAPTATAASGDNYDRYTVQPGATFSVIAKAFQVPVEEICRINNMKKTDKLRVGQELKVPKKQ